MPQQGQMQGKAKAKGSASGSRGAAFATDLDTFLNGIRLLNAVSSSNANEDI